MFKIREKTNADHKVKYLLDVDQKTWNDAYTKKVKAAVKNVKLQGFRKGHVPYDEAIKYVNQASIFDKAINSLTNPIYLELVKQEKLGESDTVIELRPEVEVTELSDDKLVLAYIFETVPEVTLGDYKSIDGFIEFKEVSEEEVQAEITRISKTDSTVVEKAEGSTLQKGDIAFLDFSGEIDGKAFEGGKAKNYELEIGSNSFIPGFEDQMVGMKVNEKRDLHLKFPADYHVKEYADKPVLFKVKLNAIKEVKLPEMTVEKINELMKTSYKTLEEAKTDIKARIHRNKAEHTRQMNTMLLNEFANSKCQFSHMPKALLDPEVERLYQQFAQQMGQLKMTIEDALKLQNLTKEQLLNRLTEEATKTIKLVLVLEKISSVEKVEVSEAEINEEIEEQIKLVGGGRELEAAQSEALKKYLESQKEMFESLILNKKVVELVIKQNLKK
ncbi:trigger factor [Mycoplasma sp. E35C]|uniref:trigger factor n=1 Tax=Mycoplasma sp. E35C TaxID=2801918 RepID=UPI001CA457F5|nr:trigger factor [Mycoplasma sp. E35C]QZX49456.1 trigger factor [Mycoplasma sp. E35C]